jgi:DNA-binding LytR/AlgR family response regulator
MANKAAVVPHASKPFAGRSILIVEDEYFLADDLANEFAGRGADIIGPLCEVADAVEVLKSGSKIDAALLDINIKNEQIFPLADALRARNIPFVFTTGYDKGWVGPEFADVPLCEKPLDLPAVVNCLAALMSRS